MGSLRLASRSKVSTARPAIEVIVPRSKDVERQIPNLSRVFRELRIEIESGSSGIDTDQPKNLKTISRRDVEQSFDDLDSSRFGSKNEDWIELINRPDPRKQIILGILDRGIQKPVAIGILSKSDKDRRLDHFSFNDYGHAVGLSMLMIKKAKEFHDGESFRTDVITSNINKVRHLRGLGFEETGAESVLMIGRIAVPQIEMEHPGDY